MKRLIAIFAALAVLAAANAAQTCIISGSTERPAPGTYSPGSAALPGALDAIARTHASGRLSGRLNGRDPSGGTVLLVR